MTRLLPALTLAALFAVLAPFDRPANAADKPKPRATTLDVEAKEFFFKPKDRIVFLGDSITEQYQYSS